MMLFPTADLSCDRTPLSDAGQQGPEHALANGEAGDRSLQLIILAVVTAVGQ